MTLRSFLAEELWLFLLFAIILALAVPDVGMHVTPYAIYALMVVMFFTSLGITLDDVKNASQEKKLLLLLLFMSFVMTPLIALLLSQSLNPEMSLGLIIYAATPSAMATAFFMRKLKKDAAFTLVITAVTTLISPIITPLVVTTLTSSIIEINPMELFFSLVKIVIIPFAAAELVRQTCKYKKVCSIREYGAPLSTAAFFFVVFGVVSASAEHLLGLGHLALVCAALLISTYIIAYFCSPTKKFEMGYSTAVRNATLSMVLALEIAGPIAALPAVTITLMHNAVMVPAMFWSKKH